MEARHEALTPVHPRSHRHRATDARALGDRSRPHAIAFWARHLGVAKVRGTFRSFSGTVDVAEEPERSSVRVTIDAASIDTREPSRDEHLRSPDLLDVANHPTLTFVATSVSGQGRTGPS